MKRQTIFYSILLILCAVMFHAQPAQAADVVIGDGTPASCTETAFDMAWAQLYNDLGGTVRFNCGAAPHTIGFYTAKDVDDIQITVEGNNAITLQALTIQPGGSGTRLFQIFEGGFLTLQNIVLTGGRAATGPGWGSQGGSIVLWDDAEDADSYEVASLTLRNSAITNSASSAWGGAIANEGGIVHLENSGIYASSAPYGGAFNGTGYETFSNVTISGNTATQAGGGLRFWRSPRVQITDSNITENFANTLDGGGIDNQGANVTINGSYVEHNTAARHGGGIQNQGTLTITQSSISENTASSFFGGGVNNNNTLVINQTTLRSNQAAVAGGAIYNGGGTLSLANSTLATNNASQQGGAIYTQGVYTITDSTFQQNSSAGDGGGLFANNSTGTIQRALFSGNQATAWGGGIGIWEGNATVSNSHLLANRADYGGGLTLNDRPDFTTPTTVKLYNTLVQSNTASVGGGLFNYGGYLYLHDSWLTSNTATNGGGVSSLYTINTAGDAYQTSALYSYSTIFYNNQALTGSGGALYSAGYLTVENSLFQNNRAAQYGGAIAKDSSTHYPTSAGQLRYNTFASNFAAAGGALHNVGTAGTAITSGSSLYLGNLPDTCAGALIKSTAGTGYNLSSDGSCLTFFTEPSDRHAQPLPNTAQPYQHTLPNGLGTVEFILLHPSASNPAINAIPQLHCGLTIDLFGRTRPGGDRCDIGAIETDSRSVDRADQAIEVTPVSGPIVGSAPFTLNATSSSGLPVSFSSSTPLVCTVNNSSVTPVQTGTCTLLASQIGDAVYNPATTIIITLSIVLEGQGAIHTLYLPVIQQ